MTMRIVKVELGERSYPVLVGPGARHELPSLVPEGASRAAVVTQEAIPWVLDSGVAQEVFKIGPGEEAKSLSTVEELCRGFSRMGLTRSDVVVAVGGGVVTDVAGFAAAVYHRGVPVLHVATTLLAQVDAAIGGKTGVNVPEGKNLVGAFWQPAGVICDTDTIKTLEPREYRSGLGEMAKYAFLGVDGLGDMPMEDAVANCVACKAAFVADDEREASGRRALLNYGHTLAHALETAGSYELRHGEAVGIGLCFAARLARALGRIGEERVFEHYELVGSYGLPTELPVRSDPAELIEIMRRDKKVAGASGEGQGLTFVLDGPEGLEVVRGIEDSQVRAVLEGMDA